MTNCRPAEQQPLQVARGDARRAPDGLGQPRRRPGAAAARWTDHRRGGDHHPSPCAFTEARTKNVSVAASSAELRLHACWPCSGRGAAARRRRGPAARTAASSRPPRRDAERAAQKPAPLAKTLASIRVGEDPTSALRFKAACSSFAEARLDSEWPAVAGARRASGAAGAEPKSAADGAGAAAAAPRAAAADRRGASGRQAAAADAPAAAAGARADVQRGDPDPPPAPQDADKENAAPGSAGKARPPRRVPEDGRPARRRSELDAPPRAGT